VDNVADESKTISIDRALKTLPPVREARSEGPASDHRIIELERAATIAEAARPSPKPPAPSKQAAEAATSPEPRPFFGGLPDDPGVRNPAAEPEPKTRLRLF